MQEEFEEDNKVSSRERRVVDSRKENSRELEHRKRYMSGLKGPLDIDKTLLPTGFEYGWATEEQMGNWYIRGWEIFYKSAHAAFKDAVGLSRYSNHRNPDQLSYKDMILVQIPRDLYNINLEILNSTTNNLVNQENIFDYRPVSGSGNIPTATNKRVGNYTRNRRM